MLPGTVINVPNKPWQGRLMGSSAWDKLVHVGWVFNSFPFLFNFLHHIPTLTQRHTPPNSVCICSVILKVVHMYPRELTLFILYYLFFFLCPKTCRELCRNNQTQSFMWRSPFKHYLLHLLYTSRSVVALTRVRNHNRKLLRTHCTNYNLKPLCAHTSS